MKLVCPHCSNSVNLEHLSFELDAGVLNAPIPENYKNWIKKEFVVDLSQNQKIKDSKEKLGISNVVGNEEYVVEPMQKFFSYETGVPAANERFGMPVFRMDVRHGKPILRFDEEFLGVAAPHLASEDFRYVVDRVLCPFCYGYLDDCFFDECYSWVSVGLIAKRASTKSVSFMMMSELSNFSFMGGTQEVDVTNLGRISLLMGSEPEKSNALAAVKKGMADGKLPKPTEDLWCLAQPVHMNYGNQKLTIHFNDFAGETINQVDKVVSGANTNPASHISTAKTRIVNLDAYIVLVDAQDLLDNQLNEIDNILRSVKSIIEKSEHQGKKNLVLAITKADLLFARDTFQTELPKAVQNALMYCKNMDYNGFRRAKFNMERHLALQPALKEWAAGKLQAFAEALESTAFRDISVVFTAPLGRNIGKRTGDKMQMEADEIGKAYQAHCEAIGISEAKWKGLNSEYAITGKESSFLMPFYPMDPIAAAVMGAAIHRGGECAINNVSDFLDTIEKEGQRLHDLKKRQDTASQTVNSMSSREQIQDLY